ncbi:MAG: hypothetical protein JW783_16280 [Bacteroidales bacterium]|nr:hypothetical protein [Bacteroidales bacterium]MBN2750697.1 hypothetical protein [Bacteroidales bacterium]
MSITTTSKRIALVLLLVTAYSFTLIAGKATLLNHTKLSPCIESIYLYNFREADSLCRKNFHSSDTEYQIVQLNLNWWKMISGYDKTLCHKGISAIFQRAMAIGSDTPTDTEQFLIIVAGIFQLRADSYMGKKTSAMRNALKILPHYKRVLGDAQKYDEFTFLAGIYNYGLGAISAKHPFMFPAFFVFPDPNPTLGYTQLIACEKRGNLLLQQESCYFRYKIGMEIREEPQLAYTIVENMCKIYPSNPILSIEKIKTLKKLGKPIKEESNSLSNKLTQQKGLESSQKGYLLSIVDEMRQ